jgi:hypothetical protein
MLEQRRKKPKSYRLLRKRRGERELQKARERDK